MGRAGRRHSALGVAQVRAKLKLESFQKKNALHRALGEESGFSDLPEMSERTTQPLFNENSI
mgnify:CR=1 FL=1